MVYQIDDCTRTPLHMAAGLGQGAVATLLLAAAGTAPPADSEEGVGGLEHLIAAKDKFGDTALHCYAAGKGLDGEMVSAEQHPY